MSNEIRNKGYVPFSDRLYDVYDSLRSSEERGEHTLKFGPQIEVNLSDRLQFNVSSIFFNNTLSPHVPLSRCNELLLIAQSLNDIPQGPEKGKITSFRYTDFQNDTTFVQALDRGRTTNFYPATEMDFIMELAHFHLLERLAVQHGKPVLLNFDDYYDWNYLADQLGLSVPVSNAFFLPPNGMWFSDDLDMVSKVKLTELDYSREPVPIWRTKVTSVEKFVDPTALRQYQLDHFRSNLLPQIKKGMSATS